MDIGPENLARIAKDRIEQVRAVGKTAIYLYPPQRLIPKPIRRAISNAYDTGRQFVDGYTQPQNHVRLLLEKHSSEHDDIEYMFSQMEGGVGDADTRRQFMHYFCTEALRILQLPEHDMNEDHHLKLKSIESAFAANPSFTFNALAFPPEQIDLLRTRFEIPPVV